MGRRLIISLIALLLLVALVLSYSAIQGQAEDSPAWIEVYPPGGPRMCCSQGGPFIRELINIQLWPDGPGVKLVQERQKHLGLLIAKFIAREKANRLVQERQKHLDLLKP